MIYLNIWLTANEGVDPAEIRDLLTQQATLSRQEPGCVRFDVYQSQTVPGRFILHEQWESKEALDAHRTAKAYTTIYQPLVIPKVSREAHPSDLVI
jgi:quinol monooxygenase YgiN